MELAEAVPIEILSSGYQVYNCNKQLYSFILKTYAAISNAHLSRVWKRVKLSGSRFRPLTDSDQHSFLIFLCHIGVPTFSWQIKVIKVCPKYLLTSS